MKALEIILVSTILGLYTLTPHRRPKPKNGLIRSNNIHIYEFIIVGPHELNSWIAIFVG